MDGGEGGGRSVVGFDEGGGSWVGGEVLVFSQERKGSLFMGIVRVGMEKRGVYWCVGCFVLWTCEGKGNV